MSLRYHLFFLMIFVSFFLSGCRNRLEEKGFAVAPSERSSTDDDDQVDHGIARDSLTFPTRPGNVFLTGHPQIRIATIFKVNFNRDSSSFIGDYNYNYNDTWMGTSEGNQWNSHLFPGFEALYGYNLVNVAHYDTKTQERKSFFARPVLIKTVYWPSFSKDTLNNVPVHRNYFMISAYDEDTNKDGFINLKDLRRLYYFDMNAENKRNLVPANYSVYKAEYDPDNDYIYVFARLDEDKNGRVDANEVDHIFWIDLKNPSITGRQY